jgi:hypothetical protein
VKERDRLEDVKVDERLILKRILQIFIGRAWPRVICSEIETNGQLL